MIKSLRMAVGPHLLRRVSLLGLLGLFGIAACATAPSHVPTPRRVRGGVSFIGPRCAGAQSCLLGHVTAAESGAPLERAAIFLQVEGADAPPAAEPPGYFVALTDEQGVFTIVNPPTGSYRMAIYSNSRRVEVSGLKLGSQGTVVVPVRLPKS